jgi:hypothetical protein
LSGNLPDGVTPGDVDRAMDTDPEPLDRDPIWPPRPGVSDPTPFTVGDDDEEAIEPQPPGVRHDTTTTAPAELPHYRTRRDRFAEAAVMGRAAAGVYDPESIAEWAWQVADAMEKRR